LQQQCCTLTSLLCPAGGRLPGGAASGAGGHSPGGAASGAGGRSAGAGGWSWTQG